MYLFPTDEDIARLYCFINPKTRFLLAAQEAINELTKDFHEAIDSYLALCESEGIEPETPSLPD